MSDLQIFTADSAGVLTFGLADNPSITRGIPQLTQEVVVELLSEYRPDMNRGTGLLRNLSAISSDDEGGAEGLVLDALSVVKQHIMQRQQGNARLTPEERLRDLRLLSVTNQGTLTWKIDLEMVPQSGGTVVFSVPGVANGP